MTCIVQSFQYREFDGIQASYPRFYHFDIPLVMNPFNKAPKFDFTDMTVP